MLLQTALPLFLSFLPFPLSAFLHAQSCCCFLYDILLPVPDFFEFVPRQFQAVFFVSLLCTFHFSKQKVPVTFLAQALLFLYTLHASLYNRSVIVHVFPLMHHIFFPAVLKLHFPIHVSFSGNPAFDASSLNYLLLFQEPFLPAKLPSTFLLLFPEKQHPPQLPVLLS